MYSGVSGRCAPADVEPGVFVGPLYLDRTGSLPRAQMAADGATLPFSPSRSQWERWGSDPEADLRVRGIQSLPRSHTNRGGSAASRSERRSRGAAPPAIAG